MEFLVIRVKCPMCNMVVMPYRFSEPIYPIEFLAQQKRKTDGRFFWQHNVKIPIEKQIELENVIRDKAKRIAGIQESGQQKIEIDFPLYNNHSETPEIQKYQYEIPMVIDYD